MDFWQSKVSGSDDSEVQRAMSKMEDELVIALVKAMIPDEDAMKMQERLFRAFVKRGIPAKVAMECMVEASTKED